MAKIKGKQIFDQSVTNTQIADDTILQDNLGLVDPEFSTDATTKDYTDTLVENSISVERAASENSNMVALDTTYATGESGYVLACNTPVLADTIFNSSIEVYINGIKSNVEEGSACIFSPDGILIRKSNDVRIGDKLYWSNTIGNYNLDETDIIDFKYLTNDKSTATVEVEPGDTTVLTGGEEVVAVKFNGTDGDTSTLTIGTQTYTVGFVGANFVFDIGGADEFTFIDVTDSVNVVIDTKTYTIRLDGLGSAYVSIVLQQYGIAGPNIIKTWDRNITRLFAQSGIRDTQVAVLKDWACAVLRDEGYTSPYHTYMEIYKFDESTNTYSYHSTFVNDVATDDYRIFDVTTNRIEDGYGDVIYVKFIRESNSQEKIVEFKYNSDTDSWGETATIIESADISSFSIYGNICVVGNRVNSGNSGKVFTSIYDGNTWNRIDDLPEITANSNFGGEVTVFNEDLAVVADGINTIYTFELNPGKTAWINPFILNDTHTLDTATVLFDSDIKPVMADGIFATTYQDTNLGTGGIMIWDKGTLGTWVPAHTGPINDTLPLVGTFRNLRILDDNTIFTYPWINHYDDYVPTGKSSRILIYTRDTVDTTAWGVFELEQPRPEHFYPGGPTVVASKDHIIVCWKWASLLTTNWESYYSGMSHYKINNENYTGYRLAAPNARDKFTTWDNRKVYANYTYTHPFGVAEGKSIFKWSVADSFAEFSPTVEVNNETSSTIRRRKVEGKVVFLEVAAVDENGNQADFIKTETNPQQNSYYPNLIFDNDNDRFGASTVTSSVIKLTISTGSIAGNGPGVYYIQASRDFIQNNWTYTTGNPSSGSTDFICDFGTASHLIMEGATSTATVNIKIGGSTFTSTITGNTSRTGIPEAMFKTYTVGSCQFTIEKQHGWS